MWTSDAYCVFENLRTWAFSNQFFQPWPSAIWQQSINQSINQSFIRVYFRRNKGP